MKIKLCGMRRFEEIEYVNEFLPDYVGFVFAPSKRRVTAEQAAELVRALHPAVRPVGVFVNEAPERIEQIARCAGLVAVQLHGDEDAADILRLKEAGLRVWKAVRVRAEEDIRAADRTAADALVLDSFQPDAYGGTGKKADWKSIAAVRPKKPFFLAGGLNADNLEAAVRETRPFGVDLSGGIETDGVKDRKKIEAVMRLVRSI